MRSAGNARHSVVFGYDDGLRNMGIYADKVQPYRSNSPSMSNISPFAPSILKQSTSRQLQPLAAVRWESNRADSTPGQNPVRLPAGSIPHVKNRFGSEDIKLLVGFRTGELFDGTGGRPGRFRFGFALG